MTYRPTEDLGNVQAARCLATGVAFAVLGWLLLFSVSFAWDLTGGRGRYIVANNGVDVDLVYGLVLLLGLSALGYWVAVGLWPAIAGTLTQKAGISLAVMAFVLTGTAVMYGVMITGWL